MKITHISALLLVAGAVAACSSSNKAPQDKPFDYRASAVRVKSLEVPPDLTASAASDRYGIPGADGVARYSDYSRGLGNPNTVLPTSRNVQLMRSGEQRWLLVNDKPENLWPLIKAFWVENGLTIKVDDPAAGIMDTDWAENAVKKPPVENKGFGKIYENRNNGERDMYHTRLERSKDGSGTEIYIQQSGLQEVRQAPEPGDYVATYKWLPRPRDVELEATMLQLLMAKLSGLSGTLSVTTAAPAAPAAASSVQLLTAEDGSKRIQLGEPFDKSWRKVSLALDQAKLVLEDKDRSKGLFYLRPAKNAADSAGLQVSVKENASGCELIVTDSKGVKTPDAQRVLESLYPILSKL